MRENETTEFKREYTDDIKKEALAFLNSNGGTIYIGIDDSGTAVGISDTDDTMRRVSQNIRLSIKPDCSGFVKIGATKIGGKDIVKIAVAKGTRKPYYLAEKGLKSSGVYIRVGSTSVQAGDELIRTMIKEADNERYESQISMNQELTFGSMKRTFEEHNLELNKNKMKSLGLLNRDGFYTNLAQLLSDQCRHSVKCAIFEGLSKDVFKDRKEFTGSIFEQIDSTINYINVYNKNYSVIEKKERKDFREYPERAVREAVLNAFVHRDYSFSGSILVNLYDDRIEVMSLGGLPKGLNEQLLKEGISECRNENLADIFYRLKYIEAYGTGIPRIFTSYEGCIKKPKLDSLEGAFRITLPNQNFKMTLKKESTIDAYSKIISEYLESNDCITKEIAAGLLGVKPPRAYIILEELSKSGILAVSKIGRKNIYRK